MALTITNRKDHSQGDLRGVSATVAFDSSYLSGGESLTPADLGIGDFVGPIEFTQGEDGYIFKWDDANDKILAYAPQVRPQLVVEEVVTMTTDVGTLAFLPAYIIAITDTTAGVVYRIIPVAETPVNNVSVTVNFLTGLITNAGADGPPTLTVTYCPQQNAGVFAASNMVIDETAVAASAGVNLANRAAAIQYVYNTTNTAVWAEFPPGEAPAATGDLNIVIDNSSNTTLDTHSDDDGDTITVTYLKYSGITSPGQAIDDTDITLASEVLDWGLAAGANYRSLVIPGYGTRIVGEETGSGNEIGNWSNAGDTPADGIASANLYTNVYTTNNTSAFVTLSIPWLVLDPLLDAGISPVLTEVLSTTDLSAVSVQVYARGR